MFPAGRVADGQPSDLLDGLWCDEDFADWYPRDGRPRLSPAQLATVCVLQFLLGLSDRQAAEAVRAALEEVAGTSPHLLDDLADEDWGRRYGRPVRLGKDPTKPMTRILATGNDAVRLLEHPYRHGADRVSGPRVQALRQIMMQN
jgi:hypothetical protein